MHFEGDFTTPSPRRRVFDLVTDPNQVARCMPGFKKLDVRSETEFDVVVGVGVAVIRGDILLHFKTVEREPPSRVKLLAHGTGLGSAMDVEMVTELSDGPTGGTVMKWRAEATIGGQLGSVSQGLIRPSAERIIRDLFGCLGSKLK